MKRLPCPGAKSQFGANSQSVYLRLSTRALEQPKRILDKEVRDSIIKGAYWLRRPGPASRLAIAYCGAMVPEALRAAAAFAEHPGGIAVLAITSPDRLFSDWRKACEGRRKGDGRAGAHIETILGALPRDAGIITLHDGYPAALAWMGGVRRNPVHPLGVGQFGQSGDLIDLFRFYGIDPDAVHEAARELATRR